MARYRRQDAAYHSARKQGYRSRAALKLEELDRRFRLFRGGLRVVDLGCWPGGWLQVASQRVGPEGRVVGVDLTEIEPLEAANVTFVCGDVRDEATRRAVAAAIGGTADLVLADLAPKLSGVKVADAERHLALVDAALEVAQSLLGPRGRFLVKLFSPIEREALRRLRGAFAATATYRPPSSRRGSAELYALAERPLPGGRP
ncbi:MAG: RlmE family RNA methyltransferase [Deltaproteobacteria bacterium]|nr:MAG: RlmE family RNA methyltransferase [Deltaproteobacteria bacterium]